MTWYRCESCGWNGSEDELGSREVDMEEYYGVGTDFPNHHHRYFSCCPVCGGIDDLEEIPDPEDEEDEDEDE